MTTHDYNSDVGNYEALPVILENGRKVYGPPPNYKDPPPTYQCELYVTRIPQQLDELSFLRWLHRIGPVYEFRLMMDSGSSTRGYAFIRYCTESHALAAFELLKHLFVWGSEDRLGVYRSQGKNRLYISGIPRVIPLNVLQDNFKMCFPQMNSCTAYPPMKPLRKLAGRDKEENRGYAFIEFKDHEMALEAKKRLTPGRVRMWGVDLKVQWAKPKEELQAYGPGPKVYNGYSNKNNIPFYMVNDFCAKLRLYCLANNFNIPIVVYGPAIPSCHLQYAGILLKKANSSGMYSMLIFEISFSRMMDIHLAMCELAVKIIERQFGHLFYHGVFRIITDTKAELVYTFKSFDELQTLNLARHFNRPNVVRGLALSLHLLAEQNSEKILVLYKRSFLTNNTVATFELDSENPYGKFYSILPKFRNNKKLNNNFNDMEITLLQNPSIGLFMQNDEISQLIETFSHEIQLKIHEPSQNIEQFTLRSQHGYAINYMLQHIDLNSLAERLCYHGDQRVNSNPVWIAGQSYQKSIYN